MKPEVIAHLLKRVKSTISKKIKMGISRIFILLVFQTQEITRLKINETQN